MTVRVLLEGAFYDVEFSGILEIRYGPTGAAHVIQGADSGHILCRQSPDQTPIAPKCQNCGRDLVPVPGWPGFGGCLDCIREGRSPNIFGSNIVVRNPRTCFKLEGFK